MYAASVHWPVERSVVRVPDAAAPTTQGSHDSSGRVASTLFGMDRSAPARGGADTLVASAPLPPGSMPGVALLDCVLLSYGKVATIALANGKKGH
jgi:hypothetical protein